MPKKVYAPPGKDRWRAQLPLVLVHYGPPTNPPPKLGVGVAPSNPFTTVEYLTGSQRKKGKESDQYRKVCPKENVLRLRMRKRQEDVF